MDPASLIGRFKSKKDIHNYIEVLRKYLLSFLTNFVSVQLYILPMDYYTKDYLKQILKEEKALLSLSDVKQVAVPKYDELSVA